MTITRLSTMLLLLLAAARAAASEGDVRLPAEMLAQEQLIELDLDPAKLEYSGRVLLTVRLTAASPRIALHSVDHTITKLVLSQNGQPITTTVEKVGPQRAFVSSRPFAPGTYQIEVVFSAKLSTQGLGLYRAEVDGQSYVLSQFESDYARQAFPCLDEPGFKFPYQLSVRAPRNSVLISNTPIEKETPVGADRKQVLFKKTPPMPSYLLALAVGPFDSVPIEGMSVPGRVYTQKGKGAYATAVAKVAPAVVGMLEAYFGRKYPYDKLDFIAAPEFLYGGMENPGAIVYRDASILLRPEDVTHDTRNRLVELVSHEVAHIWFGDLVTMRWWDDLWLNESFASWMESKVMDEVAPDLRAGLLSVESTDHALIIDSRRTTRAIRKAVAASDNLETLIDELTYSKGQAVLEMFEAYLGRAKFQSGIVQYMTTFAWKNTTADDLWQKLTEATTVDVKRAMSTFLDQPGAPLITVTRLGKNKIRVEQKRLGAGAAQSWIVPIVLKYSDGTAPRTQTLLLDQPKVELELPVKHVVYVHPNADERGYYRWLVGADDWRALLDRAPHDLSTRERLGLLTNGSALFRLGQLDGVALLRAMERLTDDSDLRVLQRTSNAILALRTFFEGTRAEAPYAAFGKRLHGKMLARLSPLPKPDEKLEESSLRGQLLAGACAFGDEAALRRGRDETKKFLADPKAVHPTLVGAVLECGATVGDRALFEEVKARFEKADAPIDRARYLMTLSNLAAPELFAAFLEYFATGPLRPQEITKPIQGLGWSEARRRTLFAFTKANYEALVKRVPPSFRAFLPSRVLPRCDRAAFDEGKAFFLDPARKVDGVELDLGRAEDTVDECVRVRAKSVEAIERSLGGKSARGGKKK